MSNMSHKLARGYLKIQPTNWQEDTLRYKLIVRDDSPLPTGMEEVCNKAMVFKVLAKVDHFKNRAMSIPVVGITYDADLVQHYCPSLSDDQDYLSNMLDEDDQDGQSEIYCIVTSIC